MFIADGSIIPLTFTFLLYAALGLLFGLDLYSDIITFNFDITVKTAAVVGCIVVLQRT